MLILLYFVALDCISGTFTSSNAQLTFLPKATITNDEDIHSNEPYCLRFSWLGAEYNKESFYKVENKTCSDVFNPKDELCIDPMTVTENGKSPDINYILDHFSKIAVCKLSDDQVCAKYTVYYNGIASKVTRYCTRIDIESGGQMRSGCVVEKRGARTHELCACRSELGRDGICNRSSLGLVPNSIILMLTASLSNLFLSYFKY